MEYQLKQIQKVLPTLSEDELNIIYRVFCGFLGYERLIGEVEGE